MSATSFDDAAVQELEHSLLLTVRQALLQDRNALAIIVMVVFAQVAAKALHEYMPDVDQGTVDFYAEGFKQNVEGTLAQLREGEGA